MNWERLRLPFRNDTAFGLLALSVFLVPLALSPFSYEGFESVKLALWMLCLSGSLGLFFLKGGSGIKYHKSFYILFSLFLAWSIVAASFSPDRLFAFLGFYYRFTNGVLFYSVLALFGFLLINFLDKDRFLFLLKILLVDAIIISIVSVLQGFGWIFYAGIESTGFFRGPSLLGNSNFSAMFLTCVIPFAAYFYFQAQDKSAKIYYLASGLILFFGLFLLSSRAGFLGLGAAVLPGLLFALKHKLAKRVLLGWVAAAVCVGALAAATISTVRPSAVSTIFLTADPNTYSRFYAWEVSIKGILNHPILGNGLGNYALFFETARQGLGSAAWGVFDDAHNIFLHLAATGGLPLLILFLGLLALPLLYGWRKAFRESDYLSLTLISSLAAWVVSASFNPVSVPLYQLLVIALVGLLLTQVKEAEIKFFKLAKIFGALLALVIFASATISLITEHMLKFSAAYLQNQNYVTSYNLAKKAWVINPTNGLLLYYKAASIAGSGLDVSLMDKDIKKLIELHPKQAFTYSAVSNLYSLAYFVSRKPEALDLAISYMKKSLEIDPEFWERQGQLALFYYQKGDLVNSKQAAVRQLALNPDDYNGWLLLAKLYQIQNDKSAMLSSLSRAYKANPRLTQLKYIIEYTKQAKDIKLVPLDISVRGPSI